MKHFGLKKKERKKADTFNCQLSTSYKPVKTLLNATKSAISKYANAEVRIGLQLSGFH